VVDRKHEVEFAYDNKPYVFVDMETGDKVKVRSNEVKQHYTEQIEKFNRELKLRCAQYHIDFIEADMNKEFKEVLLPYLVKRMKMK
jgi:hypothetical protein